jgi:hypothetical protein
MKCAVETGSRILIYIPSFANIGTDFKRNVKVLPQQFERL